MKKIHNLDLLLSRPIEARQHTEMSFLELLMRCKSPSELLGCWETMSWVKADKMERKNVFGLNDI